MANPNYNRMTNKELIKYVKDNYQSGSEVKAEDSKLYQTLVKSDLLGKVFSPVKRDLSVNSLDDFVQEVIKLDVKSASELKSKDTGLYSALQKKGLLRDVFKRKN